MDWNHQEFEGREDGKIFIPNNCQSTTCRVHFVFHRFNKEPFEMANKKRYNTLGALNNIIMVYPSARTFDTWFVGDDRDNAESKLVAGVQAMIDRVTGGGSQPPNQC